MPEYRVGMLESHVSIEWCQAKLLTRIVEISPSARALCQDTHCKKEGVKIAKGELRFGTYITFEDRGSWKWKHWYDAESSGQFILSRYLVHLTMTQGLRLRAADAASSRTL